MAPGMGPDPIVRVVTDLGAPTGEGTIYVTANGVRWRTTPYGGVRNGCTDGDLVGGGKFGPSHVQTR